MESEPLVNPSSRMMNYNSEDGSSILNPASGLEAENSANNGNIGDQMEIPKGDSSVLERFHEDALQQVISQ